jgi:Rod binding domain-containing protein
MDAVTLQFNPADPAAWRERLVHGAAPEAERLAATSQEFEALLLRQYLSEALRPMTENGTFFGGNNQVYSYLVTDALARGLSSGGVFGFSSLLQAQLAGARDSDHDNDTDPL